MVELPKRGEDEALGDAPLLRVDRTDHDGTYAGDDPSIAIRIAWVSSSDRLCADSPFVTGFAKTRVFEPGRGAS